MANKEKVEPKSTEPIKIPTIELLKNKRFSKYQYDFSLQVLGKDKSYIPKEAEAILNKYFNGRIK